MQAIGAWEGTATLFEPTNDDKGGGEIAETLEDYWAPTRAPHEQIERFWRLAIEGRILTPRMVKGAAVPGAITRLCIKNISANGSLAWTTRNVALRHKPVFVIRHPCAVVASLRRMSWPHYKQTPAQLAARFPRLLGAFPRLRGALDVPGGDLSSYALRWCLSNYVPTFCNDADGWMTVSYEALLGAPTRELGTIFERWRVPALPAGVVDAFARLSRTTWRRTADFRPSPDLWKRELSADESREVLRIVGGFGYSGFD